MYSWTVPSGVAGSRSSSPREAETSAAMTASTSTRPATTRRTTFGRAFMATSLPCRSVGRVVPGRRDALLELLGLVVGVEEVEVRATEDVLVRAEEAFLSPHARADRVLLHLTQPIHHPARAQEFLPGREQRLAADQQLGLVEDLAGDHAREGVEGRL